MPASRLLNRRTGPLGWPGLATVLPLLASASPGSIDLSRSPIAQGLMGTLLVVEPEIGCQARLQLRHLLMLRNVDVIVFYAPPQPFDEHVVQRTPPPVLAHRDPGLLQTAVVFLRRELCAPTIILAVLGHQKTGAIRLLVT